MTVSKRITRLEIDAEIFMLFDANHAYTTLLKVTPPQGINWNSARVSKNARKLRDFGQGDLGHFLARKVVQILATGQRDYEVIACELANYFLKIAALPLTPQEAAERPCPDIYMIAAKKLLEAMEDDDIE